MKNIIYLFIVSILLSGCVTTGGGFGSMYNEAIANGTSVMIVKDGNFKDIYNSIVKHLESLGYRKILHSDQKQGFYVLVKDQSLAKSFLTGAAHMYKIIIKFTKAEEDKTRIDLLNGTDMPIWARGQVDRDIQQIADLIKSD
jgi:hypothetical protein